LIWTQAIEKNLFATWPSLTAEALCKHLPKSLATAEGLLKATPKNLRSASKVRSTNSVPPTSTAMTTPPSFQEPTVQTHFVQAKVIEITGQMCSDQTGHFPITSSKGNKCVMVVCNCDSMAILAKPIKNQSELELLRACSRIHKHSTNRGLKPQLQKLDNKCSAALKQFMRKNSVDFQLMLPCYDHQQNAAKGAIGIWKDHFVAGLASLDANFPMCLWCRLIDQCTQTLNLTRPSRINPRLSAEAQLDGAFDHNKTPLAPPGTKVLIHETPNC
jgi:hypothetical protein